MSRLQPSDHAAVKGAVGRRPDVLMTASSFPEKADDWRGRFIYDMLDGLAGTDSISPAFWGPPGELPGGVEAVLSADDAMWLRRMAGLGGIAHLLRNRPLSGAMTALGLMRRLRRVYRHFEASGGALVHVNWLQNALPLAGTSLPALITVLGSDLGLLRLPGMVEALRAVLRRRRVILAPNAEWMVAPLEGFFGDLAEVRAIPFGIHRRWFAVERDNAATASGDWLVVSRITRGKLGHLLEWGEGLFDNRRRLHLLGPMQEQLNLPEWVRHHGATHPQALAEEWFPRVQGLLTLSSHDEGRPQVMIEAMAAGVPIVASELPAHRDLLQDGLGGCLVADREALCEALARLEQPETARATGAAGRRWVAERIGTWDDCAQRYLGAYRDLLERA